ncbi:MAG: Rrf2 family transcriptional regulator [Bacteroidia bacterium]|nr:Rrf2 family transcriptional regulator [Winogradskyella sp.]MBT8375315.1 Rrf2 family transcriptional regulator [Bacteroidia bacterium]NNF85972.1 Rrf2 family transcriptional regulator [Winogradskyella sp.]NNL82370.1 Rrf2 family transcriptional regulator [Winogradskyella sp.]
MFSNSAKYAIKAVLYLAVNSSEEHKIMIKDLAKPINVPRHYLAKLLQDLSKKHLVSSIKGPKGGFYLSAKNRKEKVIDIINAVDGEERMKACLLSLEGCNANNPCSLHHLIYDERQAILKNLNKTSLDHLAEHIKSGKSILPL